MKTKVDHYSMIERYTLWWVRQHQTAIKAELYSGANDNLTTDDVDNPVKRYVLPSSITGSDRYMYQQYCDAITLWHEFGHPDGFLTWTFNPDCRELKEQLREGETGLDRPDIVARIFKLKKDQIVKDLESEHIFGIMLARTHSIEYQKRYVLFLLPPTRWCPYT